MECKNVTNFLNCGIRYAFKLKMKPHARLFQCTFILFVCFDCGLTSR